MSKKYLYLFMLFGVASCFKDEAVTTTTVIKNNPRYIIKSSELVVEVADENNASLVGLTASFNDNIKLVDKSSYFHFDCKDVNQYEELLQITDKEGYVHDYVMPLQANQVNYKRINVFLNKKVERFASNQDQLLELSSRIKVQLKGNNYSVKVNQIYTGEIQSRYINYDIDNEYHFNSLPGGRFGYKDNQSQLLEIEDAFEFNLYSSDKQKLGLRSQAYMTVPLVKNASALYYYDPASHVWSYQQDVKTNEKISLVRTGTYCIAQATKFSILKGKWVINNIPAKKFEVQLVSSSYNQKVITSNSGSWQAIVPRDEAIDIIYQTDCESSILTKVKPTSNEFDAGTHFTDSNLTSIYQFTGSLKDCKGTVVDEGFLKIYTANGLKTIYLDSSHFDIEIPICSSNNIAVSCATVTGDIETSLLTSIQKNNDLSTMYLCSDLKNDYIVLNVDGKHYAYNMFDKVVNNKNIQIGDLNVLSQTIFLSLQHDNTIGVLANTNSNIVWRDANVATTGIDLNCPTSNNCGFTDVQITYWTQDRSILKGKFKGRFWLKLLNPIGATYKDISGEFQLKQ